MIDEDSVQRIIQVVRQLDMLIQLTDTLLSRSLGVQTYLQHQHEQGARGMMARGRVNVYM